MNKILSVIIVGLFAANAYATDLPATSIAKKVEAVKHTAAPAKKASLSSLFKKDAKKNVAMKTPAAKPVLGKSDLTKPAAK